MSQFWPEVIVGALLIAIGLLELLAFSPCVATRRLISTGWADKSGFLLIIIGSFILFFIVLGSIAGKTGLIN